MALVLRSTKQQQRNISNQEKERVELDKKKLTHNLNHHRKDVLPQRTMDKKDLTQNQNHRKDGLPQRGTMEKEEDVDLEIK